MLLVVRFSLPLGGRFLSQSKVRMARSKGSTSTFGVSNAPKSQGVSEQVAVRAATAHQQPHRQRAVNPLVTADNPPGVGADGQRALLRHDGRVAGWIVGLELVPEEPLVLRRVAVGVHSLGVLQHRPALVRRVVRVQAVVGRVRVALDRNGLGLPQPASQRTPAGIPGKSCGWPSIETPCSYAVTRAALAACSASNAS